MGIDFKELVLQACVVNIEEGQVMELEFDSFVEAQDFIIDNLFECKGMSVQNAKVYYKLVPKGTPFGDANYHYCGFSTPWLPLNAEQVRLITENYQAALDVQTMKPCGVQCVLRLYVEDPRARLLLERDFATFGELNAFIAENPDLEELVGEEYPVANLGMVETFGGRPSRVPLAVTEDEFFLGMSWEPLCLERQEGLVSAYRKRFEEREERIMGVLSQRDQDDLASEKPSRKAELLHAVVSCLIRKRYDVSHAQTIAVVCEPGSEVPNCYDTEIAFESCRSFPLPIPEEIPFSKALGKIVFLSSAEPYGDFSTELESFKVKNAGLPFKEFNEKLRQFVVENRDTGTLELLLGWAMTLPERPCIVHRR